MDTLQKDDRPLLDLTYSAVRRMMKLAKKCGDVTHDELNAVLPPRKLPVEQIEDLLDQLSEMGITVVESEETQGRAPPWITANRERGTDEQPKAEVTDTNILESPWVSPASRSVLMV